MAVAAQTRPRPGGGRLFIIVGILLAALAFGGVLFIASTSGHGGGAAGATVKVVVAAQDIPLRAQLGKADVTLADYSSSNVPPKSYSKLDDVVKAGFIAELNISKGQPITENMLAKSGDIVSGVQPAYLPIPPGFVAVTIPTGEQQGVAGFIQAGDYINVIASVSTGVLQSSGATTSTKAVVKTVFTNLHVLRLGTSTGAVQPAGGGQAQQGSTASGGVTSSMTVVVTQCDAEYLKWLLQNAALTYTLGSYKDYQPQDTKVDPTCANAAAAKGVGPSQVDQRWHFTGI